MSDEPDIAVHILIKCTLIGCHNYQNVDSCYKQQCYNCTQPHTCSSALQKFTLCYDQGKNIVIKQTTEHILQECKIPKLCTKRYCLSQTPFWQDKAFVCKERKKGYELIMLNIYQWHISVIIRTYGISHTIVSFWGIWYLGSVTKLAISFAWHFWSLNLPLHSFQDCCLCDVYLWFSLK